MNVGDNKDEILEYINFAQNDSSLEFEAIMKKNHYNPITKTDFSRIMSRLKSLKVPKKVRCFRYNL